MNAPLLELEGVAFSRPGGFALQAAIKIAPGERVALMGASGSGKSTLLDLVAGFEMPDAGRILFSGRDLTASPPAVRPVSILFQENNLFGHLDAFANAGLGLSADLKLDAAGRAAVAEALARVGLGDKQRRLPHELSGGERQRTALARILLRRRPLLLLDEPFASLGPAMVAQMLDLVDEVAAASGAAVILATHDLVQSEALASRVLFLAAGRIVHDGPVADLRAGRAGDEVSTYLGIARR